MTNNARSRFHFPHVAFAAALAITGIILFSRLNDPLWTYVGDSLCSLARYSFHFSGVARGEYPLWNPLVRGGEPSVIAQIVGGVGNPLPNLITASCAFLGVQDIALAYTLCVFLQVLLYAAGVFLLIREWTGDASAGAFAGMLAAGSSTVFFCTYHVVFVMMLHALPWILYAATAYVRKPGPRPIILLGLASCVALYSYEVVMGASYLLFLLLSLFLVYRPSVSRCRNAVAGVPAVHWILAAVVGTMFALPAAYIFLRYNTGTISFSRFADIALTDSYALSFRQAFERLNSWEWLHPYFWVTLFTGRISPSHNEQVLRQVAGPLAFPFLVVALWSRERRALAIALSGTLVCLLAADTPPVNLIFRLPLFDFIRNGHFLLQFLVFAVILMAGIGFHGLSADSDSPRRHVFMATASILAALCVMSLVMGVRPHAAPALVGSALLALTAGLTVRFLPEGRRPGALLALTALSTVGALLFVDRIPPLGGLADADPFVRTLRGRTDHRLEFSHTRPADIQHINDGFRAAAQTDFGADEYSSFVTLQDNAFKTAGQAFGLSSYPMPRQTLKFMLLPSGPDVARRKFLFQRQAFVSRNESDMAVFQRDPKLLSAAAERGIGLADAAAGPAEAFDEARFRAAVAAAGKVPLPAVTVKEYRANSAAFSVTTKEPGILVYTDSWDPDWRAALDGRPVPVRKAFHTFKAVELPAGTHELEFTYHSRAWPPILLMHIVFVLALLWLLADSLWPALLKRSR